MKKIIIIGIALTLGAAKVNAMDPMMPTSDYEDAEATINRALAGVGVDTEVVSATNITNSLCPRKLAFDLKVTPPRKYTIASRVARWFGLASYGVGIGGILAQDQFRYQARQQYCTGDSIGAATSMIRAECFDWVAMFGAIGVLSGFSTWFYVKGKIGKHRRESLIAAKQSIASKDRDKVFQPKRLMTASKDAELVVAEGGWYFGPAQ